MRRTIKIVVALATIFCNSAGLPAQSAVQAISLESVLRLGGANNLTIKAHRHRQELASANLALARQWWLPVLSAGISTHQLQGAAMNGNGLYYLDVERNSLWAGVQADLQWDLRQGFFNTSAARQRADAAEHFSQAGKNQVLLEAINAYYDFQTAQLSWQAWEQLAKQASSIATQVAQQVQAGLGYESEGLLAKSNANHLKVEALNSKAEYGKKSAALVRLLNLDPNTKLLSVDTVLAPLELANAELANTDFSAAHQHRAEVQGMTRNLQALLAEKKSTTLGLLLPELTVSAYAARFGGLFEKVPPTDPASHPNTDVLYPTKALNLSLIWRIPLGRLTYAGALKQYKARISLQQTRIEEQQALINEEIIAAKAQLLAAREQMNLAKDGVELAAEALRQSLSRQQLGTVRPFEILQAQEVFIKNKLDYLRAVATHNKAQYALWVAMGHNL